MATPIYNFSPGPAVLPQAVLRKSQQLLCERHPLPLLEIGHRSTYIDELVERMQYRLRNLLNIPDDYEVLFTAGGTRAQYAAIAMNLAYSKNADYFATGYWSDCAIAEARKYISEDALRIVAEITEDPLLSLTTPDHWQIDDRAAYHHYVSNETLVGFEFFADQYIKDGSLVVDMTSNFLTCAIDIRAHRMIYAGAQKNAGIAGLVYIIIESSALSETRHPMTPILYDYRVLLESGCRPTTPPLFSWWVAHLMLEWIDSQGGVDEMQARCRKRAAIIYGCIDKSSFYVNPISPDYRSRVNVFFHLPTDALEQRFISAAEAQGLIGLKGHSQSGGIRASLYNGMPISGAETLAEFMEDFERRA